MSFPFMELSADVRQKISVCQAMPDFPVLHLNYLPQKTRLILSGLQSDRSKCIYAFCYPSPSVRRCLIFRFCILIIYCRKTRLIFSGLQSDRSKCIYAFCYPSPSVMRCLIFRFCILIIYRRKTRLIFSGLQSDRSKCIYAFCYVSRLVN
jgi:hypothetical protein